MRRLLAVAAVLAALPAARADQLDARLNSEAPKLVAKLVGKKYANVGLLRFQVTMPARKASYRLPLSGSMPTRIETGLVIHGADQKGNPVLGVIHDAGQAAVKQKAGGVATADERRKLFGAEYTLAWENRKVKADAFLTGKVEVAKSYKEALVTIQSFDRENPAELETLATFTVRSDLNLLRDLGMSLALPRGVRARAIKAKAGDTEIDEAAIEQVVNNDKVEPVKPADPDKPETPEVVPLPPKIDTKSEPGDVGGIEVQMLVDGKVAAFRKKDGEGDAAGWEVDSPLPGKAVAFRLANKSDKKLGVVLRVNGMGIVNMDRHEAETSGKVILEPGKSTVLKGYYMIAKAAGERAIRKSDDDPKREDPKTEDPAPENPKPAGKPKITLVPFKIAIGAEAKAAREELGDKAGLIEADVFELGSSQPRGKINQRGLPPSKDKIARETYKALRTALLASSGLKTKVETRGVQSREVILPQLDAEREEIKGSVADFPNPLFVARVAVRIAPSDAEPMFSDK